MEEEEDGVAEVDGDNSPQKPDPVPSADPAPSADAVTTLTLIPAVSLSLVENNDEVASDEFMDAMELCELTKEINTEAGASPEGTQLQIIP